MHLQPKEDYHPKDVLLMLNRLQIVVVLKISRWILRTRQVRSKTSKSHEICDKASLPFYSLTYKTRAR
jgi:hypothetical protein